MKIRNLDLTDNAINAEHEALGLPPVEDDVSHPSNHPVLRIAVWAVIFLLIAILCYLASRLFNPANGRSGTELILETLSGGTFWKAVAVGLLAQTVDGALGMAYGITSTTFLLVSGASPAVASASVHIAEVFTTGISGISHVKLGNVNKNLFLKLLIPGMVGSILGAWTVSSIDGSVIKPYIAAYLFCMGLYIISKIFKTIKANKKEPKHIAPLGLFGGFVDAVGGGGWGPVVTTTLVGTGQDPRTTIGSVNLAEFFLTFVRYKVLPHFFSIFL
ncbi:MAG: sulfite exporter TauE/SafE family protein, partial [Rubrivivax sp.]